MVGSCTTTKKVWHEVGKTWFIVVEFSWKSDTNGDVSGVGSISNISGRVEQVTFIPASGDVTPSADYDVQILDEWGRDVLFGCGANLSASAAAFDNIMVPYSNDGEKVNLINTSLNLVVANAGDSKEGTVILLLR